jgi:hypothetical protein
MQEVNVRTPEMMRSTWRNLSVRYELCAASAVAAMLTVNELMCWNTKVVSLLHVYLPLTVNKVDSFLQRFNFFFWHLKKIIFYIVHSSTEINITVRWYSSSIWSLPETVWLRLLAFSAHLNRNDSVLQRNWSKNTEDHQCQACLMRQFSPLGSLNSLSSSVIKLHRL